MSQPDGGPAFPTKYTCADLPANATLEDRRDTEYQTGMSLRDYFAAAALQGILAMHADPEVSPPSDEKAARLAYAQADAMLREREK